MRSPQYCVRFQPKVSEEIRRLAEANGVAPSRVIQELVRDGIIVRAEQTTNSQFYYVEQRLRRIEARFAGWMVKLTKAVGQTWFFTEQLALFEVDEEDQVALRDAVQNFTRVFLQQKTSRHLKDDQGASGRGSVNRR